MRCVKEVTLSREELVKQLEQRDKKHATEMSKLKEKERIEREELKSIWLK